MAILFLIEKQTGKYEHLQVMVRSLAAVGSPLLIAQRILPSLPVYNQNDQEVSAGGEIMCAGLHKHLHRSDLRGLFVLHLDHKAASFL